jgi:hypothetical protein
MTGKACCVRAASGHISAPQKKRDELARTRMPGTLGMHASQQHPDETEYHSRQRKIDDFGCKISKNVARRHDESPTIVA